ncbi:MAG: fluoride efflux transporter CrcB [Calditerrivibrio sp.]|nr:fluoride efflux transporter CrcB [Calditerrivibrio sp.]MCA1933056.1 fluoride efflux transporter CrcB [Calditerrivibrio sp.]MCA1979978.1 fluoride efflux transporter CrcB [Calditerrivibrio sp.]
MKILYIGLGGFLGAVSRYFASKYVNAFFGDRIPLGTVFVNITGSFILGFLYVLSIEKLSISDDLRLFIGVGFLGAYTTFSTFSVEFVNLLSDGSYLSAGLYWIFNVIFSIIFAFLGIYLARL